MAFDLRPAAGDQRTARGRDRLHRGALARSAAAGEGRQEPEAGRLEPARQSIHLPSQPSAPAVQQSEDPASAVVCVQSEGLPRRGDRRPDLLQDLQVGIPVRHRDVDQRRHGRLARVEFSEIEGSPEGSRVRWDAGRADALDRPSSPDQPCPRCEIADGERRLQGRHAVDGLADAGCAPRQEGPAECWRLERVHDLMGLR